MVLPRGSTAEKYVEAIEGFLNDPDRYARMSRTARERYFEELNWRSMASNILASFQRMQAGK